MLACEGCVNKSLYFLTIAKDLSMPPQLAHSHLPHWLCWAHNFDWLSSAVCLTSFFLSPTPHLFLHRMKNWIRSTPAFWKKNGPQSSDYKRRFVGFFPPQRRLVGIEVLWIGRDLTVDPLLTLNESLPKKAWTSLLMYNNLWRIVTVTNLKVITLSLFVFAPFGRSPDIFQYASLSASSPFICASLLWAGYGTWIQTEWSQGRDHFGWACLPEAWPERVDPTPTRKVCVEWPPQSSHPSHLPPSLQRDGVRFRGRNNKG